jgi:hypothetical protein
MTFSEFKASLPLEKPVESMPILLKALWYDGKGNWEMAHNIAQQKEGNSLYDRIHAYLHRKEGDAFNARYWYNRVNLKVPPISLDNEWEELVKEYLVKI